MSSGEIEVDIDGLGSSGDGVARLSDGRVVFVEGGIPGDRLKIALAKTRKKVQYGDLIDVIKPSPDRIASRCDELRCGGCPWRCLELTAQIKSKRDRVEQTLRRIGGITLPQPLHYESPEQGDDGWGYRHRVRLHAMYDAGKYVIGYHARRSRVVIPFQGCPVIWPELEAVVSKVCSSWAELPREVGLTEVEICYSRRDQRAAAHVKVANPEPMREWFDNLDKVSLSGVSVVGAGSSMTWGNIELRYDHAESEGFDLRFEPRCFTQASPRANDDLVAAVVNAIRPRRHPNVWELHAGIGNFSLPLAKRGARVWATESNRRSSLYGQRNAKGSGGNVVATTALDTDVLEGKVTAPFEADVLLLDPPRTGARGVAENLARKPIRRVVYISCDPATLARDAKIMVEGGYRVVEGSVFDLFPQTSHVETLLVLEHPDVPENETVQEG